MRRLNRLCGTAHFGLKNIDVETCIRQSGFVCFFYSFLLPARHSLPELCVNIKGLCSLGRWFIILFLRITVWYIRMSSSHMFLGHENISNDFCSTQVEKHTEKADLRQARIHNPSKNKQTNNGCQITSSLGEYDDKRKRWAKHHISLDLMISTQLWPLDGGRVLVITSY